MTGISCRNWDRRLRPCGARLLAVALLGLMLPACANVGPAASPQWSEVGIADFTNIAGRWEGTMQRNPQSHQIAGDDWVQVAIRHDGEYAFQSYRQIGVFRGHGTLTVEHGKATARTEAGRVTFSLHEADGIRMLRAHGTSHDGIEYSSDLRPAR
jgi:hypothetical protein